MDEEKKIGVMVETDVNFYSIKPLLEELRKKYQKLTVFTMNWPHDVDGYQQMFKNTRRMLRESGYEPELPEKHRGEKFDLYMAPYVWNEQVEARCYMKYSYGSLYMKPSLTHVPSMLDFVDVALCQDAVSCELLKAYGLRTYLVDNLKFCGVKREALEKLDGRKRGKKRILFAPTYNDSAEAEDLRKVIRELKKEYYVIVKEHHGTSCLKRNREKKSVLEEADEHYSSSDKNIVEIMMGVDVCLLGASGAVGEAMYAGVPCAIFEKELDKYGLGEVHSTAYDLAEEDIVPCARKVSEVRECLRRAMSAKYCERQKEYAEKMFPIETRRGVQGHMEAIEDCLNDELFLRACWLHHYAVRQKNEKIQSLEKELERTKRKLQEETSEAEELKEIMNGGLHKMAEKVYRLRGKRE